MKQFLLGLLWIPLIHSTALAQDYQQYLSHPVSYLDSLKEALFLEGYYQEEIWVSQALRHKLYPQTEEKDSLYAVLTLEIGQLCSQIGQYEQGEENILQSLVVFQEVLGDKHPVYADALTQLGNNYLLAGDYEQALQQLEKAKSILEQAQPISAGDYSENLVNLSDYYSELGNYKKALTIAHQALKYAEIAHGRTDKKFAFALTCVGRSYRALGDYEQAKSYYLEARNIREKELGTLHPEFTVTLNDLAIMYYEAMDYEAALSLYLEIKSIDEQRGADNTLEFSALLNNLSAVIMEMGEYDKALDYLLQSIAIDEAILGPSHADIGASYHNLAFLYHDLKDFDKALYYYLVVKEIYSKSYAEAHPDYISTLANLAPLYFHRKEYPEMVATLQEGIALVSNVDQPLDITPAWRDNMLQASYPSADYMKLAADLLDISYNLLYFLPEQPLNDKQASFLAEVIIDLNTRLKNELYDDKDKLRILQANHYWLQLQLSLLEAPENTHQAFEVSDRGKSVLLLQSLQSEDNSQLGFLPENLVQQEQTLHQNRAEIQALLLENRSQEEKRTLQSELIKANMAITQFKATLEKNYPRYYQLKHQDSKTTVEDIQAELEPHTALLEYAIGDSVIHIFYIDQEQVQWFQIYVDNKLLEKRIKSLRRALTNYELLVNNEKKAYRAYTKYAHWFYQTLLAPALKDKEGLQNLILVTDGKLGHLPFETFLVEEAPQEFTAYKKLHYLLQDYNISYSYSAALWKENNRAIAAANNGQMLGVAANYNLLDSSILEQRIPTVRSYRRALVPLPNARAEVEALSQHFKGFFAFDEQASEKIIKEKAPEYAILHFATHGILDKKSPVLSSLALTETGDSTENNFWQAYEISKMNLKANLVVLSACETGYGKFEQGNGMASLARSFMYAGAPSLVVSLWQVNDYATSKIMQEFYQNLSDGMKKDAALKQAKLTFMSSTTGSAAHPALWSPFIQMGNTSSIHIAPKTTFQPWLWGLLGGSILVAVGLFWSRSKREK